MKLLLLLGQLVRALSALYLLFMQSRRKNVMHGIYKKSVDICSVLRFFSSAYEAEKKSGGWYARKMWIVAQCLDFTLYVKQKKCDG